MQKVRVGPEKVRIRFRWSESRAGSEGRQPEMLRRVTVEMLQLVTEDGKGFAGKGSSHATQANHSSQPLVPWAGQGSAVEPKA
jgi:hypothetical protein